MTTLLMAGFWEASKGPDDPETDPGKATDHNVHDLFSPCNGDNMFRQSQNRPAAFKPSRHEKEGVLTGFGTPVAGFFWKSPK
jgi:hypothetical protein